MKYRFSAPQPHTHYLRIEAVKENPAEQMLEFRLSSWRPGRYELGNFAKNLRGMSATGPNGETLAIHKVSKDCWRIELAPQGRITLQYEYYAAQPDAGACWLDAELMYVNPVHCIVYDPSSPDNVFEAELDIPHDWQIACGLPVVNKRIIAADLNSLLDSPFFAAKALHHRSYSVSDYNFHVWFHGQVQPEWERILADFKAFTSVQLDMMKYFPVADYHFLILMLPFRFYHGVEHTNSTVLALGPGYQLMQQDLYTDLLGVASHELFHVWNVKTLRPKDFLQYDYTRENYSRLGWVYEGFTTYYGDLFLARSSFFKAAGFFAEINQRLQRHFDNYGKYFSSVAESSFDTWLDGYVPGTPWRKTSIYDEGCLIALLLDLYIRRSSQGKNSLDDLFVQLYQDFAMRKQGYREQDVLRLAVALSDEGVQEIFDGLIHQRSDYSAKLQELLPTVGCWLSMKPSAARHESAFGFRTVTEGGVLKVTQVVPGSPAEKAGLAKDDELMACNDWKVEGNLSDLIAMGGEGKCQLLVFSQRKVRKMMLQKDEKRYFDTVSLLKIEDADPAARAAFTSWTGLAW